MPPKGTTDEGLHPRDFLGVPGSLVRAPVLYCL